MKIISFNINGIRARPHQLSALYRAQDPDIIGLQEIKVHDEEFPAESIRDAGYHVIHHGQKGHYGVALISKQEPLKVRKGFPGDDADAQRRMIMGTYRLADGRHMHVINGYFPQGENREHPVKFPAKVKFYADLQKLLECEYDPADPIVVMGDFNIAPLDLDIGIGEPNAKRWLRSGKTSFLPEEREMYQRLMDWGFTDTYRKLHPTVDDRFSWFDYRSRGFEREPRRGLRIDMILATATLAETCVGAGIDYDARSMTKPSDHAPIWAEFSV